MRRETSVNPLKIDMSSP